MAGLCQSVCWKEELTRDEREIQLAVVQRLLREILPFCKGNVDKAVKMTAAEFYSKEEIERCGGVV